MPVHQGYLQGHLDAGYRALLAVRREDEKEAAKWCRQLESTTGQFLYGSQWRWLAAVAAVRGDHDSAISLLHQAFSEGLPLEASLHTDPDLNLLRGKPTFDALIRPRG